MRIVIGRGTGRRSFTLQAVGSKKLDGPGRDERMLAAEHASEDVKQYFRNIGKPLRMAS